MRGGSIDEDNNKDGDEVNIKKGGKGKLGHYSFEGWFGSIGRLVHGPRGRCQ